MVEGRLAPLGSRWSILPLLSEVGSPRAHLIALACLVGASSLRSLPASPTVATARTLNRCSDSLAQLSVTGHLDSSQSTVSRREGRAPVLSTMSRAHLDLTNFSSQPEVPAYIPCAVVDEPLNRLPRPHSPDLQNGLLWKPKRRRGGAVKTQKVSCHKRAEGPRVEWVPACSSQDEPDASGVRRCESLRGLGDRFVEETRRARTHEDVQSSCPNLKASNVCFQHGERPDLRSLNSQILASSRASCCPATTVTCDEITQVLAVVSALARLPSFLAQVPIDSFFHRRRAATGRARLHLDAVTDCQELEHRLAGRQATSVLRCFPLRRLRLCTPSRSSSSPDEGNWTSGRSHRRAQWRAGPLRCAPDCPVGCRGPFWVLQAEERGTKKRGSGALATAARYSAPLLASDSQVPPSPPRPLFRLPLRPSCFVTATSSPPTDPSLTEGGEAFLVVASSSSFLLPSSYFFFNGHPSSPSPLFSFSPAITFIAATAYDVAAPALLLLPRASPSPPAAHAPAPWAISPLHYSVLTARLLPLRLRCR